MLKDTWILDGNMNITNLMPNKLTCSSLIFSLSTKHNMCIYFQRPFYNLNWFIQGYRYSKFLFWIQRLFPKKKLCDFVDFELSFSKSATLEFSLQLIVYLILFIYTLLKFWIPQKY